MIFYSILYEKAENRKKEVAEAPDFFRDLNLDQIIDEVTAGRDEYNLKPFFYTSLDNIDTIEYRHEIMRDLENESLLRCMKSFIQNMHKMREYLALSNKLYYKYQKERWFLDAVEVYCNTVSCLTNDLNSTELKSRGFLAFREFIRDYSGSDGFISLFDEIKNLNLI